MYVFSYHYICVLILVLKQAAERKRLDWGAHAASTANVPKPQGQLVVEGDVGGSLTDQAAVNKCAIVGEGNVVLWRGDGECEILMPNACVAQSLGKGCGWLWTNAGGLRQIRGAPKAKGPVRAPPVKVERRVQAETGDVLVSRADLVLTLKRRDGTELVMHRDASEMVSRLTYHASSLLHATLNTSIACDAPLRWYPVSHTLHTSSLLHVALNTSIACHAPPAS